MTLLFRDDPWSGSDASDIKSLGVVTAPGAFYLVVGGGAGLFLCQRQIGFQRLISEQGFPYSRRQVDHPAGGVFTDALQHIDQVRVRIDTLEFTGYQQTLNHRDALSTNFRPGE
jgi:hypothetical protein